MLLNSLIAVNFIIPLLGMIIFCVNKKGLKIDHVFLFSAGFLYFWIMPLMTYQLLDYKIYNDIIYSYDVVDILKPTIYPCGREGPFSIGTFICFLFNQSLINDLNAINFAYHMNIENYVITNKMKIKYLIIVFCIYTAFIIGELISSKIKYKTHRVSSFSIKPLDVILYLFLCILIGITVFSYNYYFKGYTQGTFGLKAQIIALNVFLLSLMYMYFFNSKKSDQFSNIFSNKYFVIYMISSLLLLSLGNRTWFMSGIISFLVVYTNFYKRISFKYSLVGVISFILLLGIIPQIRAGNTDEVSMYTIIYIALYDSFAVFHSLKYFLISNGIDYFNYPIILFSKIPLIIPSFLMPNKSDYYISLSDIGVDYIAIQAAWHTFPTLMINFGIIGSVLLAFISPIVLQYLKQSAHLKTSYITIVAYLAAPFFRDFDNYAIKIVLQMSIIMPILYLIICHISARFEKHKNI